MGGFWVNLSRMMSLIIKSIKSIYCFKNVNGNFHKNYPSLFGGSCNIGSITCMMLQVKNTLWEWNAQGHWEIIQNLETNDLSEGILLKRSKLCTFHYWEALLSPLSQNFSIHQFWTCCMICKILPFWLKNKIRLPVLLDFCSIIGSINEGSICLVGLSII